jgi:hypothetical protein
MFGNKGLRKILGPKSMQVTGQWRKLHKKQRHDLYCSPNSIHVTDQGGRDARSMCLVRTGKNARRILVGKPEDKRPLRRLRGIRGDNINTSLRGTGWYDVNWTDLAQDR